MGTRGPASPLSKGLGLYRRGLFFEAHEEWEGLWRKSARAGEKRLLQGLIQIAAGFHKLNAPRSQSSGAQQARHRRAPLLVQGNREGAFYLLERALEKFSGIEEGFGLDWGFLRRDLQRCLQDLRGSCLKPDPPRIKIKIRPN